MTSASRTGEPSTSAAHGTDDRVARWLEGKTQVSTAHAELGRHEQADQPGGAQEDSQGHHLETGEPASAWMNQHSSRDAVTEWIRRG